MYFNARIKMKNDKINTAGTQHSIAQKSQAIYHHTVQKPISQIKPLVRKIGHNMDIARSKSIAHFAPRPTGTTTQPLTVRKQFDVRSASHPLTKKIVAVKPVVDNSAKAIKEAAIAEAFNKLSKDQKETQKKLKHRSRLINILIIILAALSIAGYFIYVNIPSISVNVASAQAGIKAVYPEYCPEGYSLSGPVTSSEGQVTINFHANSNNRQFSIVQKKSSWDSSAVRSKVNTDSKGEFITTEESGLTIYTYNGNAAWVNGGILYTITGDAQLSTDQIRHIAISL